MKYYQAILKDGENNHWSWENFTIQPNKEAAIKRFEQLISDWPKGSEILYIFELGEDILGKNKIPDREI